MSSNASMFSVNGERGDFLQRIKLIVSGGLRCGTDTGESGVSNSERLPTRCVFQFNGQDGADEVFPVEYVLRMMSDWASVRCDPYVRIQNTGVSVLIQGFFSAPPDAPIASITADQNNVILKSTQHTGINLSTLEEIKKTCGLDPRPMQAIMWVSCFVRMPMVQLSFRFMGPEDPARTQRLMDRITELSMLKRSPASHQRNTLTTRRRTLSEDDDTRTVSTSSQPRPSQQVNGLSRDGVSIVRNFRQAAVRLLKGNVNLPTWAVIMGVVILIILRAVFIWIKSAA
ncbi:nuclear egress membrane protein [Spheniscid alphaherpesvirus 1]|uniref:Nuclear egress membrane protein n=1 Tax=Spheniscid alphaherpesvirus 1 TaxID=2560777 RepID=A0A1R3T451_9ALPH|nr:nuclear egress membrane protein [Spheniscid alphaherpesvirus 1]SCO83534.1 nuclear egress membrane protein [Spheniscid alphaherpesvirus 1]